MDMMPKIMLQEVHIGGPEGHGDLRVVNSYPSKIGNKRVDSNVDTSSSLLSDYSNALSSARES